MLFAVLTLPDLLKLKDFNSTDILPTRNDPIERGLIDTLSANAKDFTKMSAQICIDFVDEINTPSLPPTNSLRVDQITDLFLSVATNLEIIGSHIRTNARWTQERCQAWIPINDQIVRLVEILNPKP